MTGRQGQHLKVPDKTSFEVNPFGANGPTFSGYAFDRIQSQGIIPSFVKDALENGVKRLAKDNTTISFSVENNVGVVIDNATGKIVTVDRGLNGK